MLEDRKRVLDKLVNQQYKDNLKAKVKNDRECEQILEYIYEQYNIDYKSWKNLLYKKTTQDYFKMNPLLRTK